MAGTCPTSYLRVTLSDIVADARRYGSWFNAPGFWVTCSYRVRRLRKFGAVPWRLLLPFDILLGLVRRQLSDTIIPSQVPVGPGLYLPHPNGVIFNSESVIGAGVSIFQQVTLGAWRGQAPTIGNGTALYAGAKIIGGAHVGRNCKIGANVVLSVDVPDNFSVAMAAPTMRARGPDESGQL